jgi:hypothetical protein
MHLGLHGSVFHRLVNLLLLPSGLIDVSDRSGAVECRSVVLSNGVSLEDTFGKIWVGDEEASDSRHITSPLYELLDVLGIVAGGRKDHGRVFCGRIFERRVRLGVIGRSRVGREVDASNDGSEGVVRLDDALLGVLGLGLTGPVSGLDKVNVLQDQIQ